jgi:ABC-type sugar transport system ATPase subunit
MIERSELQQHGASATAPLLELRGVSKTFGHVQALDDVDFRLDSHEVVALVGDNGAGKSTLIKVLSGVYQPTAGDVYVRGDRVSFKTPADAVAHGISTVYQDLALVDGRSVAANLFLGREFVKGPFIDTKKIVSEAKRVIKELKADIPSVTVPVVMLSGGQRQAVAIGRAVAQGGSVIVMDEPTASLGVAETRRVLELVSELKSNGKSVLVISHNLQHVWDVADRIVVLHRGKVVGDSLRHETSIEQMVRRILFGSLGDAIDDVVLDHVSPMRAARPRDQPEV